MATTNNILDTPAGGGGFLAQQIFTSSDTYTPTAGMTNARVQCWGGGGGSGGSATTNGSQGSCSGGGGGGSYSEAWLTSAEIGASQTVTIGAGGAAGAAGANNGSAGGTTTFGAILTCLGGGGSGGATAVLFGEVIGATGQAASGGDINITGGTGSIGLVQSTRPLLTNNGGAAPLGAPQQVLRNNTPTTGVDGLVPGGGASGSGRDPSQTQVAGGAGGAGMVVVTEF